MVSEIERDMPAAELLEWMEYEALEPFGAWRDNWHAALLAQMFANVHRKPGTPPIPMSDFMYTDPQTAQERKDAAMLAFLEAMANG